jgi:imidazolonepropionase-like amidohydrolase
MQLAPDGTPRAFTATGHHTMGTAVAESFERERDHARWQSDAEHGDADVTGPSFYIPIAEGFFARWLVPAALSAGGSIGLLPVGKLRVDKVAALEIDHRALVCYALIGLDLLPDYSWFDADGRWFGDVGPGFAVVPAGWEKAADTLVAKQQELERARDAALAQNAAHHPPAAGLAYTHARVLDVAAGKWLADQTVVVVGDRIAAVGAHAAVPRGAEVVDLAGKALIPGLVDMHSHTATVTGIIDVAAGVTTARDVGNDPDFLDDLKARYDGNTAVGPHLVRMGFIEGRNEKAASSKVTAETPDEALAAVAFFAQRHYDGIKIYNSVRPELVPILTAEAHKRGMLVTGHIPVHMLAHEAIDAGYDGIEHVNMLFLNFLATHDTDTRDTTRFTLVGERAREVELAGKPLHDFIAQMLGHHTVIDPTLGAFEGLWVGVPGQVTPGLEDTVARLPLQVQRQYLTTGLPLAGDTHATYLASWQHVLALVKLLWQSKVTLVAGTDDGLGGVMLHHELALLVHAGIPTDAVMRMATIDAARAMRMDRELGTIAAGKRADLVVLDGDPLADITAVRKVVSTMRGGVVFAPELLLAAVSVKP